MPEIRRYSWQYPVKDKDILTPPGSPETGDRYLIYGTGTGGWAGKDYQMATWVGNKWEYTAPAEGMHTWVDDENAAYSYDGSAWVITPTKAYVDGLVAGLLDDRGNYDASGNIFPSTGGSGTTGAIMKGDLWFISVAGTLGGVVVAVGDLVRALIDSPGQTAGNWNILELNIGYAVNQTPTANTIPVRAIASTDIAMGTGGLTGLRAPVTTGETVRTTAKITEANLEDAVDKKHTQYTDIVFGLDANKGTAVVGKVYFATDTGTFYEGIV